MTYDGALTSPEDMGKALAKTGRYGGTFKKWGIPKRKPQLRAPSIEAPGKPGQTYDPAFAPNPPAPPYPALAPAPGPPPAGPR